MEALQEVTPGADQVVRLLRRLDALGDDGDIPLPGDGDDARDQPLDRTSRGSFLANLRSIFT